MLRISLADLHQPAIIVKAETGLIYTNQTNGVACSHPSQEGFLVLLPPARPEIRVFNPGYWYDEMPRLDDALYDEMEQALEQLTFWNIRKVQIDRSAKNHEAWVHVRFRGDFGTQGIFAGGFSRCASRNSEPEGYPEYEGILTWENCD